MAMDNPWLTPPQLAGEVRRLCTEKRSGTLFCSAEDHNSATIVIQDGQIVALGFNQGFKMTRGVTALPLIQALQKCKISFKTNMVSKTDEGLLDTASILQRLAGLQPSEPPRGNVPKSNSAKYDVPRPEVNPSLSTSGSAITLFSPDILKQLRIIVQEEASNAFGPIAVLLCEEHLAHIGQLRTFNDMERMLAAIATTTGEAGRGEAFRKRVVERLRTTRMSA